MNDRRLGTILLAIGAVLAGIGAIGFVTDRGGTAATAPGPSASVVAVAPSAGSPSPSATATAGPTPVPTPAPTPTPDAETRIRAFYAVFVPAIKTGDADTLLALLHPASIERYGTESCRASFAQIADPAYAVVIKTVHDPAPWDYARDDLSTVIADAWAIDVDVTTGTGTAAAIFHVAPVGGEIRWFADCGTPLGASPSP